MDFIINNALWKIILKDADEILKKYNESEDENNKSSYCFGLALYPEKEVWINKNTTYEQQISTLKHELTHVYIWEYGFKSVSDFSEEMVCDIVAASNNIIDTVVEKWIEFSE